MDTLDGDLELSGTKDEIGMRGSPEFRELEDLGGS